VAFLDLDDDPLDAFDDPVDMRMKLNFYEHGGPVGGLEAVRRLNDYSMHGVLRWSGNRPFSTRAAALLTDMVTAQDGSTVEASSVAGFGSAVRARQAGDTTHPTIEGDIIVLWAGQPGSGLLTPGYYEITSFDSGDPVLGNVASMAEIVTWDVVAPVAGTFPYGTDLKGSVLRRELNPVIKGTDLVTNAGDHEVTSATALFLLNNVAVDNHLIIETGADIGEYRISPVAASPNYLSETAVQLLMLDGSTPPAFANASGIEFRVIRPFLIKKRIENCIIDDGGGGDMRVNCYDFGAGTVVPFDVFTPGMIGGQVRVANSENPANDGLYTITAYHNPGEISLNPASATNDTIAQAVVTLLLGESAAAATRPDHHRDLGAIDELSPMEVFTATVAP
jgi:hypothetical protein